VQSEGTVSPPGPGADPVLPRAVREQVEVLRHGPLEVAELTGGLTNRNFKVTTPGGAYVVRLSSRHPGGLAVNRDHEHQNSVIAAATGVGAPVFSYLPEASALVIGYIEGRTLTDEDFSAPGTIEGVAASCRQLHLGARFVNDFDMFEIQRGYLETVLKNGYRLPEGYRDFEPDLTRIKGALAVRREPAVACHNDLLAGNFIDDGDRIRLIDYEYSGNNDACFELGNIGSECHLSEDQLDHLVTCYYGGRLTNKLARARLQGVMSQYGWTLWASIQQATSPIDFDFWAWGLEKYERAVATFRGTLFDRLIEDVQRAE
jgi:thiamine kinase-like enzyme